MEADLRALEEKLSQFIALCNRLKQENHSLRQELVQAQNDNKNLKDTMAQAGSRLEALLETLPEGQ